MYPPRRKILAHPPSASRAADATRGALDIPGNQPQVTAAVTWLIRLGALPVIVAALLPHFV